MQRCVLMHAAKSTVLSSVFSLMYMYTHIYAHDAYTVLFAFQSSTADLLYAHVYQCSFGRRWRCPLPWSGSSFLRMKPRPRRHHKPSWTPTCKCARMLLPLRQLLGLPLPMLTMRWWLLGMIDGVAGKWKSVTGLLVPQRCTIQYVLSCSAVQIKWVCLCVLCAWLSVDCLHWSMHISTFECFSFMSRKIVFIYVHTATSVHAASSLCLCVFVYRNTYCIMCLWL